MLEPRSGNGFFTKPNAFTLLVYLRPTSPKTNASLSVESLGKLGEKHQELQKMQTHLVHSEKMGSLGVLVAGVAHEINNPTNFVYGGAYNLKEKLEDLKEYLLEN